MDQRNRKVGGSAMLVAGLLVAACSSAPRETVGSSSDALAHCRPDPDGELDCFGPISKPPRNPPPAPTQDTCTAETTPLPSPSPLGSLLNCSPVPQWVYEPAVGLLPPPAVLVWTCDLPNLGEAPLGELVPDGSSPVWNGWAPLVGKTPITAYGMVKGVNGGFVPCSEGIDPVYNVCEIDGLNSDCYPEPAPGQVLVTVFPNWPSHGGGGGCQGLCRRN